MRIVLYAPLLLLIWPSAFAKTAASCIGCPFKDYPTAVTDEKGVFPVFYGGEVISKVGDKRGERIHRGIDIAAHSGAAVVAAWSGKIWFSGWNSLGGWAVIVRHSNGYVTYYAHLKARPFVKTGQKVIAGQLLGFVGKTGNAHGTVPHLHFEISQNRGRMLNPLKYL